MGGRAPTRSITYTFPEELGNIEAETLIQTIIEKIAIKQDIYLVLDQTKFGPAPNFSGKNIYVLHSGTVVDDIGGTDISASLLREGSATLKTKEEIIDLLCKDVDEEPVGKGSMDMPVKMFYNKIDKTLDIRGREYKKINPMIKY